MSVASDQVARDRIREDLQANLLVEAGAGSGKTTALVARLVHHVRCGTSVEQIAAVTFTRKAADELRERFQLALETVLQNPDESVDAQNHCALALRELDRAFLGTIHSFCSRILHEYPLEVGLDPSFRELAESDADVLNRTFWRRWVETARRTGAADLDAVLQAGIDPNDLFDGFATLMQYQDVLFDTSDVAIPDASTARSRLIGLVATGTTLMPASPPADGFDPLMLLVQRLDFSRRLTDWKDTRVFCGVLESIRKSHCALTQKRWSDTKEGKAAAKQFGEDVAQFVEQDTARLLQQWREYLYPMVIRLLRRAVSDFARQRQERGDLGFDDLLALTAKLLREHPSVRDELGERFRYLLVDEFQDTDPIQAEVCLLLASESGQGNLWQRVTPRPGALFVVGDPKQSIYRFRRADIQIYELVKRRFEEFGAVLALTTNFRSVPAIAALVNAHFADAFPVEATSVQAAFSPMQPYRETATGVGVFTYQVRPDADNSASIVEEDAALLAAWIAGRIARGEKVASDFLILTARKAPLASYARALSDYNVPVRTTGAGLLQAHELSELIVLLRALADPDNPVAVVAALEGICFGLTPFELLEAHRAETIFRISDAASLGEGGAVHRALATLHRWWLRSRDCATEVLLEQIVVESGVLFHAASASLGDTRAGAILQLIASLRSSEMAMMPRLSAAIAQLELLLDSDADDAPLRPGRADAVRVMNLHKAKGLEADTVILAAPVSPNPRSPEVHIARDGDGIPRGGIAIAVGDATSRCTIAQPVGWDTMRNDESRFQAAETDRLLYVAATRARTELIVAQTEKVTTRGAQPDKSLWRPLAATLRAQNAANIVMLRSAAPEREPCARSLQSIEDEISAARDRVRKAAEPSVRIARVTDSEIDRGAGDSDGAASPEGTAVTIGRGREWGTAVHRCIDALARGRSGPSLHTFIGAVAREHGLSKQWTRELDEAITAFASSAAWTSRTEAGPVLTELHVAHAFQRDGVTEVVAGVIDAATETPNGWRVVDWKSDRAGAEAWSGRLSGYTAQVNQYAAMLAAVSGVPATASIERVAQGV
jgi:ATP-dependent helicase/nuclease subunit A